MNGKRRECQNHSPEFRAEAGKLVLKEGLSYAKAAADLGIPVGTLSNWITKFKRGEWDLETGKPANREAPRTASQVNSDQQRIVELERQVRRLTQEREVLKKAMAYCIEIPK